MDDKKLIELVQKHNVLYDASDTKYMDVGYKLKLWEEIGKAMNIDGTTCKARWNNIRDNFRKSIRKAECGHYTNVKKYKYCDQLTFLSKYFKNPPKNQSLQSSQDEMEDYSKSSDFTPFSTSTSPPPLPLSSDSDVKPLTLEISSPYMSVLSPSSEKGCGSNNLDLSKIESESTDEKSATALLIEYMIKKSETQTPHPIDAFLNGISPILKNLNPYYQHLAKSEIFNVAQKYEMKMMTEQSSSIIVHEELVVEEDYKVNLSKM